jgi:hypothetical protein
MQGRAGMRDYACGVRSVWTAEPDAGAAIALLAPLLKGHATGQLLVFFSPHYPGAGLAAALAQHFPGIPVAGCSTAGEITPAGFAERSLVAVAFPRSGFRFVSTVITDVRTLTVERAAETVRTLRARLDRDGCGPHTSRFALSFIDGLSRSEEAIVSALGWALNDIPLAGGSAGDDFALTGTTLIHNGTTHRDAALLLIAGTDHLVEPFKHDNFEPTGLKMVVTRSDSDGRTVRELNAEPAAYEYATMAGLDPERLAPMSFAAHPVVVKIGGDYYCRSIQKMNPDGSLTFFCAIDDGIVLTVARPRDMVASVNAEFERLNAAVGKLDLVLAFECVLRRLDAETRQVKHVLSDLYSKNGVTGFHTYGEQYRSMHLNQTFTGIAIGVRQGTP